MAVKTREELLNDLNAFIGDSEEDSAITLIEDITDTLTDLENNDKENWKTKYEENDKAWRKKYRDRFFSKKEDEDEDEDEEKEDDEIEDNKTPKTFDDLFKTE